MGDGFVKLYGDRLLRSTVWTCTDSATKVVWITLLSMADETGTVRSSIPGLAKEAGADITVEQVIKALDYFMSPDPYSQTREYEGRRIQAIEGGWVILNYRKHREFRTRKQIQTAQRVARHRVKKRVTGNAGNASNAQATQVSASASGSVGEGGVGEGGPQDELAQLRGRYTSDQLAVIDDAVAAFGTTRKSGKIADSVVLAEFRWWSSFPVEQVVAGLNTYVVKKYAAEGKRENYAQGIIRNTDPLSAGLEGTTPTPHDNYLSPAQLREIDRVAR